MKIVPTLAVNIVMLVGGAVYLGFLSPPVLAGLCAFAALGIVTYRYAAKFADRHARQCRTDYDTWLRHVRSLLDGIKVLKLHGGRRRGFVDESLAPAETIYRESKIRYETIFDAAVVWGRSLFLIGIGVLLFAGPRWAGLDGKELAACAFTMLFLVSPLESLVAWMPYVANASVSVGHLEQLGLTVQEAANDDTASEQADHWQKIELTGVTHAYWREGHSRGFVLGPIDLTLRPGNIYFIVGGNGCGKTTLAKLLTGLYLPEDGEIRLDGGPIDSSNREGYRQLFATVFDDAPVFESLAGIAANEIDRLANEYLTRLELAHTVWVANGVFSTIDVSRGQRKRLALVSAYLEDRPIFVFDEWAADQDPVFRRLFYLELLPELKRRGKTVVAITHDDHYFGVADCVLKLDEGKIADFYLAEPIKTPQCGSA